MSSYINKTKSLQWPWGIFVKTDEGVLRQTPQNFQNQRKYEGAQTDAPTRWGYFILGFHLVALSLHWSPGCSSGSRYGSQTSLFQDFNFLLLLHDDYLYIVGLLDKLSDLIFMSFSGFDQIIESITAELQTLLNLVVGFLLFIIERFQVLQRRQYFLQFSMYTRTFNTFRNVYHSNKSSLRKNCVVSLSTLFGAISSLLLGTVTPRCVYISCPLLGHGSGYLQCDSTSWEVYLQKKSEKTYRYFVQPLLNQGIGTGLLILSFYIIFYFPLYNNSYL